MYLSAKFFLAGNLFDFGFAADQMVWIMGYPDRLYSIFRHLAEKLPLGEMGEFTEQGGNFSVVEGGSQFDRVGEIGGVDVTAALVFEDKSVAIKAGFGVGAFEVAGEAVEMVGGKGCEGEGAVNDGATRLDGVPMDGEADEFGEKEALFEPVLHGGHDFGRAENVQGRAPGAQPERLDERGDLAVVVAVHVADPENFRDVWFYFFAEHEAGGGGTAVEEQAGFPGLDEDAGMFAARAGVSVCRTEKDGAHEVDVAGFYPDRQSKLTGRFFSGGFNRRGSSGNARCR